MRYASQNEILQTLRDNSGLTLAELAEILYPEDVGSWRNNMERKHAAGVIQRLKRRGLVSTTAPIEKGISSKWVAVE